MRVPLKHASVAALCAALIVVAYLLLSSPGPSRISLTTLIDHFTSREFSEPEEQLIGEFSAMAPSDSAALESYVSQNRSQLRQLLPKLLDRLVAADLTDSGRQAPLSFEDLERLSQAFARIHQEPAPWRGVQLYAAFTPDQKRQKLEADYRVFRGDSLRRKRQYREAISELERALVHYENAGDLQGEANAYFKIGYAHYVTGNNLESLAPFHRSLELARQIGDPYREMWAQIRIGDAHSRSRNYPESEKALSRGIQLSRQLHDRRAEVRAKNMLGFLYWETGRLLEALAQSESSLQIYETMPADYGKAEALRILGFTSESLGDYARARSAHETSLHLFRQLDRKNQEAAQYINLGLIYSLLGEHSRALECHQAALAIFRVRGRAWDVASALANVGEAYANLDMPDKALKNLREALTFAKGPDYAGKRAEIYQMIGQVHVQKKDWGSARDMLSKALAVNQQNGFLEGLILSHLGLGQVDLETRRLRDATAHFDQALQTAIETGIATSTWKAYFGKGRALKALGEVTAALRNFETAVDTIESARSRIETESSRLGYFAEKQEVYDEIVLTYLNEQSDAGRAFDFVERAKARSFFDFLHGGVEIVQTENILERHDRELDLVAPVSTRSPTLLEIQGSLGPRDHIVEYRIFRDRLAIWVLDRTDIRVAQVPTGRDELRTLVRQFRRAIGAEQSGEFRRKVRSDPQRAFEHAVEIARRLTSILIAPIWTDIDQQASVYIVPDDILHYLPFAALLQPASDSTRFLVEALPLATAPSAAILKYALDKQTKPLDGKTMSLLAVADPNGDLTWARRSAQNISRQFPYSTLLIGSSARKDSVVRAMQSGYDLIHFGTHCSVDEKSPLFTALHLASLDTTAQPMMFAQTRASQPVYREETRDYLQMHEVFDLNLQATRLVVLSACETGLGRFVNGEGLVGLTRAFMYAGTPALITTLWQVDDKATARLMERFYGNLKTGELSVVQALRNAQIDEIAWMRRDPVVRFPHLYFWAPFVVVGSSQ